MDYRIKVSPERLYDAFQKAAPEERKPVLKLIEKYAIPKDEHPRYVEGKGIYVPIIGKYLAKQDIFGGEKVTWDIAVRVAAPSRDEWYIILFFKDEINRLLRENGGKELDKRYWSSTEFSKDYAWFVDASNGSVDYDDKDSQSSVLAWVTIIALGYDARR